MMENLITLLNSTVQNVDFRNEKHLMSESVLDSVALVTVIVAISENYGIEVTITDITKENFESVEDIYAMIQRRHEENKTHESVS